MQQYDTKVNENKFSFTFVALRHFSLSPLYLLLISIYFSHSAL